MKKIALSAALALASVCSYAQTANDALLFSESGYIGTARTAAMGNAFTALGGDLGSIGINPAGSAVAKYSQITLTPAVSISTSETMGVSPYSDGSLPYFDRKMRNTSSVFRLPNIGFTFNINTHRKTGLKNVTLGFIANCTNSWNEDTYANGINSTTSFMGSLAASATANGYLGSELNLDSAYDIYPWKDVVGYQSGMISTFGGSDNRFAGASEGIYQNGDKIEIALAGPLDQTFGRRTRGSKYEYLLNFGANISDFLYLGVNAGMTTMQYSLTEYFKEEAIDPSDFEIELENGQKMHFKDMKYKYNYDASSTGYFAKFGFIVTPGAGLRIGAAISTPTAMKIREGWNHYGETNYSERGYDSYASSPDGEDSYSFRAPYRANFGLAWTILKRAVISADYELCDYGTMRFKSPMFDSSRDYFNEINEDIRKRYGIQHMFRLGAEVKFFNAFAVRAGYGVCSAAEKKSYSGNELPGLYTHNASFGLGFSSKNSFFADIACVTSFVTTPGTGRTGEYIMPYDDYLFDNNGDVTSFAPEILNIKSSCKILLTLGWRF